MKKTELGLKEHTHDSRSCRNLSRSSCCETWKTNTRKIEMDVDSKMELHETEQRYGIDDLGCRECLQF